LGELKRTLAAIWAYFKAEGREGKRGRGKEGKEGGK